MHDAVLVGGSDHLALSRRDQQVAAGLAVAIPGRIIKQIGQAQVDDAGERSDDRALCVANGCGEAKNRTIQLFPQDRLADAGFARLECGGNDVDVHVVDADALR